MNQASKFNYSIGITGTNGYIGTHLVAYLKTKGIHYYEFTGDLLKQTDIEKFFKQTSVNQIVHLAGTFNLPFDNLLTKNVLTTENLLMMGRKYGLKKIIFASTGAVYGEPLDKKSKEDDPLLPNTFYGLTKKMAEDCIRFYSQNEDVISVILRFPNIYGENNNNGVIGNFLSDIKHKGEITVAGNGRQSRNFLHISDTCKAIEKTLAYNTTNVFNISNDKKITINQIVEKLRNTYSFKINYRPNDNNLTHLLLNTHKAHKELKFLSEVRDLNI